MTNEKLEEISKRYLAGTPTEDDLLNYPHHFMLKLDNGMELELVELKYYQMVVDLYKKQNERLANLK